MSINHFRVHYDFCFLKGYEAFYYYYFSSYFLFFYNVFAFVFDCKICLSAADDNPISPTVITEQNMAKYSLFLPILPSEYANNIGGRYSGRDSPLSHKWQQLMVYHHECFRLNAIFWNTHRPRANHHRSRRIAEDCICSDLKHT